MSIEDTIAEYAKKDSEAAQAEFTKTNKVPCKLQNIHVHKIDEDEYDVISTFLVDDQTVEVKCNCCLADSDNLDMEVISADQIVAEYNKNFLNRITSNTSSKAGLGNVFADDDEDDPFSDMGFEDEPDGLDEPNTDNLDASDIDTTLTNLADEIDNLKDQLHEYDIDNPAIEMNNNITNHYIAECDHCHGVFITSIVESDKPIDSIQGTCPLCDSDSTQTIKWVIRDANELQ